MAGRQHTFSSNTVSLKENANSNSTVGKMDITGTDMNNSYLLHGSQSSLSSESDLSFSLSADHEMDAFASRLIDADELPAFEIRLISPLGRTPSPIDSAEAARSDTSTPARNQMEHFAPSPVRSHPDFVALQDINAQISPPSDVDEEALSSTGSLETIFEGIFLNTPPRQRSSQRHQGRSHCSLGKMALNRMHAGKENSPTSSGTPSPRRTGALCQNEAITKEHRRKVSLNGNDV